MICRINRIPLTVLDFLKWDLGLPEDYAKKLVPEFPDYFRVIGGRELELVCWSEKLAVSVLEKKVMNGEKYSQGMPMAFPMKFSEGMEIDKKAKKWMDEWQKLPYISPYENAAHLSPSSDESDKWVAAILHEVLNLFVAKKVDRDNIFGFAEFLDIRSRIKRVLVHHPGIFYLSSKLGTYTVVLREGYKRGLLVESNPLVGIRTQYIHLMHTVKKEKAVVVLSGKKKDKKEKAKAVTEKEEKDAALKDSSGSETEDASDDDYEDEEEEEDGDNEDVDEDEDEDDDDEEEEEESQSGRRENARKGRERANGRKILASKEGLRNTEGKREIQKHGGGTKERLERKEYGNGGRRDSRGNDRVRGGKPSYGKYSSSERGSRNADGERGMRKYGSRTNDRMGGEGYGNGDRRDSRGNTRERRGKTSEGNYFISKGGSRNADGEREMRKHHRMTFGKMEGAEGQRSAYGNARARGNTNNDRRTWGSKEGFRKTEGEREMRRPRSMARDKNPSTNSRTEARGGHGARGSRERSSSQRRSSTE